MNARLLEIVACPMCQGRLKYDKEHERLICNFDKVCYPIAHGIPVLLAEQAQALTEPTRESADA
ncbi:Trm112 family protein [Necropsobacter massiliensis]|uniref:Trm112 family protein n=1 Tax=Necropsobacter massiliensis TaxID=1400001 RepID=UPI0005959288|nr:Trm112 family protein [Necropsobacter massiliensis]